MSSTRGSSFSPFICACFAANCIIGTGFLALPWAFHQAGWLVSVLCLAVVCWAENLASDYILSTMARAEWNLDQQQQQHEEEQQHQQEGNEVATLIDTRNVQDKVIYGSLIQEPSTSPIVHVPPLLLVLGDRHNLDLPRLCRMFLNGYGYTGYMICVHGYLYGCLWMFTSVFGNAVAAYLTDTDTMDYNVKYNWSIAILGGVVLPLSWLQLTEQKTLQVFLTCSRLVMMFLMVIAPIIASLSNVPHFGTPSNDILSQESKPTMLLDWSGMHRMLPIVVCAAIFHFSIPALAADLGPANKSQLGTIFAWTMVLVFVVYATVGTVDAWYFGATMEPSANVNWSHYHAGTGRSVVVQQQQEDNHGNDLMVSVWVDVAWWAKAISCFVTLFPAINVFSVFPLHALVLGNSLMAIWYQDSTHNVNQNRWVVGAFRTMAALPPLVGGYFVRDLGTILDYNGILGLAIAFVFPSLLYISSSCRRVPTTTYERRGSSYPAAIIMLLMGVMAQVTVLCLLVWRG